MKLRRPRTRTLIRYSLAFAILMVTTWFIMPFCVSLPPALLEKPGSSPVMLDRSGVPISHFTLPDSTRSSPVPANQLPPKLIACTIAAEDKRFYKHNGVDLIATGRAARDFFMKRRVVSGASTITQQLIKISSPPAKRNLLTKLREAAVARKLEMRWSKQRILAAYLNRLDYGNLRIGASEAGRFYFQKPLTDLSLAECALLAGLPQAPSWHNPIRHPKRAVARRNVVLKRLAANDSSHAARTKTALTEPLNLRPLRDSQPAPWLATLSPPHQSLTHPNPKIQTTLDLPLQQELEAIVREETSRHLESNLRHAAVVVIHNATGEIPALVSSADWNDPRGGQFNGALTPRSPGSALKPFTYLLAIEHNQRIPASILADIPSPYRSPQGLALPQNYDHAYRGPVTLRHALACSLNIPAMRELNALGGPAPLYQLLTKLGLTTLGDDPEADGLGLTLGNAPVRLLELTNAYATLARGGRHLPPTLFPDANTPPTFQLSFSETSFYLIADILSDTAARAPAFPPGGPLDLPFRCAAKTGTSSDFRDNWCLGFTPEFTVGVWAGNFENQPMKNISGVTGAGTIFHRTMRHLHTEKTPPWFDRPDGLIDIIIDSRNGKLVTKDRQHARADITPPARTPPTAHPADYDSTGRALLGATYAEWFGSRHNLRRGALSLDPAPAMMEPLKVITPENGITLLLDPEVPSGTAKLRPVTNLPGTARWTSPTLRIAPATPEPVIHLSPGTHTLTATDSRDGTTQDITLHVKTM